MIVTVRRAKKLDAVRAMNDLVENRGFEILKPLQQVTTKIIKHSDYNYRRGRYQSIERSDASCWYCQLKAPDRREA